METRSKVSGSVARARGGRASESGSALPMLLGGLLFLLVLSLSLLAAAQFLQQQRQLNVKTDALALDLTQARIEMAGTADAREVSAAVDERLQADLTDFYGQNPVPGAGEATPEVTRIEADSVAVSWCEPAKVTLGRLIWGGSAQVCAKSRALRN